MRNPRRVLLDECVPKPLLLHLTGCEALTTQDAGWASKRNGELLRLAETAFDIFLTSDKNLRYQQNLSGRGIAIIMLPTNRWPAIVDQTYLINEVIARIEDGEYREIEF